MAADLLTILVTILATARLTRLITADKIAESLRLWGANRDGRVAYLLAGIRAGDAEPFGCDWCVGMWMAPPVVVSAWAWGTDAWWLIVAGSLAVSHTVGWLSAAEPE